jgi:hypothetical protein
MSYRPKTGEPQDTKEEWVTVDEVETEDKATFGAILEGIASRFTDKKADWSR